MISIGFPARGFLTLNLSGSVTLNSHSGKNIYVQSQIIPEALQVVDTGTELVFTSHNVRILPGGAVVNTGGGPLILGSVVTNGGEFVGRQGTQNAFVLSHQLDIFLPASLFASISITCTNLSLGLYLPILKSLHINSQKDVHIFFDPISLEILRVNSKENIKLEGAHLQVTNALLTTDMDLSMSFGACSNSEFEIDVRNASFQCGPMIRKIKSFVGGHAEGQLYCQQFDAKTGDYRSLKICR